MREKGRIPVEVHVFGEAHLNHPSARLPGSQEFFKGVGKADEEVRHRKKLLSNAIEFYDGDADECRKALAEAEGALSKLKEELKSRVAVWQMAFKLKWHYADKLRELQPGAIVKESDRRYRRMNDKNRVREEAVSAFVKHGLENGLPVVGLEGELDWASSNDAVNHYRRQFHQYAQLEGRVEKLSEEELDDAVCIHRSAKMARNMLERVTDRSFLSKVEGDKKVFAVVVGNAHRVDWMRLLRPLAGRVEPSEGDRQLNEQIIKDSTPETRLASAKKLEIPLESVVNLPKITKQMKRRNVDVTIIFHPFPTQQELKKYVIGKFKKLKKK